MKPPTPDPKARALRHKLWLEAQALHPGGGFSRVYDALLAQRIQGWKDAERAAAKWERTLLTRYPALTPERVGVLQALYPLRSELRRMIRGARS